MRRYLEAVGPPVVAAGFFSIVCEKPITWMTILSVILGTMMWLFLKPLGTVLIKNIRNEPYLGDSS